MVLPRANTPVSYFGEALNKPTVGFSEFAKATKRKKMNWGGGHYGPPRVNGACLNLLLNRQTEWQRIEGEEYASGATEAANGDFRL
jgi:hypothetical protein